MKIGCAECGVEKNSKPFRAENMERSLTSIQMMRAEQAGNSVQMITVEVTDENRMDAASADSGPHQLHLSALAAIEQKDVAFADQCSR